MLDEQKADNYSYYIKKINEFSKLKRFLFMQKVVDNFMLMNVR